MDLETLTKEGEFILRQKGVQGKRKRKNTSADPKHCVGRNSISLEEEIAYRWSKKLRIVGDVKSGLQRK